MTGVLPRFTLHRPTKITDALELIDEESLPYCGGTELLLAMKAGLLRPAALVDLKGVDGLGAVTTAEGQVRIGAAATHDAVALSPDVRRQCPVLADVAQHVGNPRVRAQGTIGGNLCFAEPKSDLAPLLIALDASVELASTAGARTVAMADFVEGPYWTVRDEREILTAVIVPPSRRSVYVKYQTMERPTVGIALVATDDRYRLVVGASCEIPTMFAVASLDDIDADDVADGIDPIADLTGSEEYKRHVTGVYVQRAINRFREEFDRE